MANHPNRATATFRYIAFSILNGDAGIRGRTPQEAHDRCAAFLGDTEFVEIIDCGDGKTGRQVWAEAIREEKPLLLPEARRLYTTVFRGDGIDNKSLPAIPLAEDAP